MSTAEHRREQVINQIERIAELAQGLASLYSAYASFAREASDDLWIERIGEQTARQLEQMVEVCAPTTENPDEFVQQAHQEPVFVEAQRMWPHRTAATTH